MDLTLGAQEKQLAGDARIDRPRRDTRDRLRRRFSELGVRGVEIAQRAKGFPKAIELVDRDELLARFDLGLEGVGELPPALDDASSLTVIGPRVDEVRTDRRQ